MITDKDEDFISGCESHAVWKCGLSQFTVSWKSTISLYLYCALFHCYNHITKIINFFNYIFESTGIFVCSLSISSICELICLTCLFPSSLLLLSCFEPHLDSGCPGNSPSKTALFQMAEWLSYFKLSVYLCLFILGADIQVRHFSSIYSYYIALQTQGISVSQIDNVKG